MPVSQPSTIRRKRFRELNEIISQNKRFKGDKTTIGFSYMRWGEVEGVYNPLFKDVIIKPKDVPEQYVNSLFEHLRCVTRALGGLYSDGNEAKRLYFIGAVLFYLVAILDHLDTSSQINVLVEQILKGKNIHVEGKFEFILERGNKKICVVQAKKEDFDQGMTQDLLGCDAVADTESLSTVYGIVTNFIEWRFFRSLDDRIERDMSTLGLGGEDYVSPTKDGLKKILGKICSLLCD